MVFFSYNEFIFSGLLIKVYKSFNAQKRGKSKKPGYIFLTLKFGNHSLTPSNGLGIAATRLNTNRCALTLVAVKFSCCTLIPLLMEEF
jgi:hypothetical protein